MKNIIKKASQTIKDKCGKAEIGIILGSGLGEYAQTIENSAHIEYKDIPNFPKSTVEGHLGKWYSGELFGKRLYLMQGRFHAYEGYNMQDVTLPIRVMTHLGVKQLIITNAAGGVNLSYKPGDLMLIKDHINLAGLNPLIGPNADEFGPRFPDMSNVYDEKIRDVAKLAAKNKSIDLQEGVYCWFSGPSYETPAEIKMTRYIGGDAVGMSTVPEAIIANHGGMKILGISCITNMAAGIMDSPLDHEEVVAVGQQAKNKFKSLLDETIRLL